jgi:hypothetical protein
MMAFKGGDDFHEMVINDITTASTTEDDSVRWGLRFLIDKATLPQLGDALDSMRRMKKIRQADAYNKAEREASDGS